MTPDISHITEAQVTAWLLAKQASICSPKPQLMAYTSEDETRLVWMITSKSRPTCYDPSLETVIEQFRSSVAPAKQAAEKRATAAKLIAEAEQLEEAAEDAAEIDRERDEVVGAKS